MHIYFLFLLCAVNAFAAVEKANQTAPPPTFWQYNAGQTSQDKSSASLFPTSFWSLYEDIEHPSTAYGAYARSSPSTWRNTPDNSHFKSVHYFAKKDEQIGPKKTKILNLSSRPRISHGPRRRRRELAEERTNKQTIICKKVIIDCKKHRKHVCCHNMKKQMRQKRAAQYVDPLFGIPLANPPIPYNNNQLAKRQWKPFCPVDCDVHPDNKCCLQNQVDRFMPIGPFVQPTLLENWVSALFQLFGNDPLVYLTAKKALVLATIGAGFVLWGWLGNHLGLISFPGLDVAKQEKVRSKNRKDFIDLTSRVVFAIEKGNWMDQLTKNLEAKAYKNINRFLCCFVSADKTKENQIEWEKSLGRIECYATKSKQSEKFKSTIECVSDLVYDITLNRSMNTTSREPQDV